MCAEHRLYKRASRELLFTTQIYKMKILCVITASVLTWVWGPPLSRGWLKDRHIPGGRRSHQARANEGVTGEIRGPAVRRKNCIRSVNDKHKQEYTPDCFVFVLRCFQTKTHFSLPPRYSDMGGSKGGNMAPPKGSETMIWPPSKRWRV